MDFIFLGSKITDDADYRHEIRRWLLLGQEDDDKPRQCAEKQRHYFADKGPYSQGYGPPSCHEQLWDLDCKKGRMSKNWCFQTVVLEKMPESSLDSNEIQPVNFKRDQPWIFTLMTDSEAETLVF